MHRTARPDPSAGRRLLVRLVFLALGLVLAVSVARADEAIPGPGGIGRLTADAPAGFVGSATCAGCHAPEAADWRTSQHSGAMSAATPETVKGDFGDVTAGTGPTAARFHRDGDRFLVDIEGPDGKVATFAVSHTFGLYPLQQYTVTFPDGRLQMLPWAWDTRPVSEGGGRWFHLYPDHPPVAGDPLHWTRALQNWNFMCAECHSTAVIKGFDAATSTFHTRFSEISVGCESCHGAGAGHVAWAEAGADPVQALKGFAAAINPRGPVDWTPDPVTGSPAISAPRPDGDVTETCAMCHSRRGAFAEMWHPGRPLTDTHTPVFLTPGLFEADGLMKDEVFNLHSFRQSRMSEKGVTCIDCHEPHSGRLKAEGAQVCSQCHLPEKFATETHTGHTPGPGAPDCIGCHMATRTYMVVDPRHDHSFRIPRPDLSVRYGTPNTCTDCHADKSAAWAADAIERWHGPDRKGFQTWTGAFADARAGEAGARTELQKLAADPAIPGLVRATAVDALTAYPAATSTATLARALSDPDPMVRVAAIRAHADRPLAERWRRIGPALTDPSPAVRQEAADALADQPADALSPEDRARLMAAFAEYEAAQTRDADRAEGRGNLGVFRLKRGDVRGAEAEFRAALARDPDAVQVRINLADLYRGLGREAEADQVLRAGIARDPEAATLHFALGLSLVRQKQMGPALEELARASALAPLDGHMAYVHAIALSSTGQPAAAAAVVAEGLKRLPNNVELLTLALNGALNARDLAESRALVERIQALRPDDPAIGRLSGQLRGR